MDSNSILSSVKDPSLIKKRRDQIIKGAISLLSKRDFMAPPQGKSPKNQALALAHYTNTSGPRKMYYFWSMKQSMIKYISGLQK